MRIELTVRHEGHERDVAITAAAPVTLRALRPELGRVTGLPVDGPVWSGEAPLPDSAVLGDDGLRCGAVLGTGGPNRSASPAAALALHQVGGPGAGRVSPLGRGRVVLGRGTECDLVLADADVSRRHAEVEVGDEVVVHDLGSTNGTWVDGARVPPGGRPLRPGQLVRLGDCLLTLAGPSQVPAAVSAAADGTVRLSRPPRQLPPTAGEIIDLPQPPEHQKPRAVQWVAALVPAVAGGALAWFAHSPQFLLFMLLSPLMMMSTSLGDRLHWRRSRRRAAATYAHREAEAAARVAQLLRAEATARRGLAPDPAALARAAALPGSRVWERRLNDPDHLRLRIGSADRPSLLRVRDRRGERPAGVTPDVPLSVNLRDGPLGVAVPAALRDGLARWLVGQLSVLHSPADLGLGLLLGDDSAGRWSWASWLPHLQGRVATGRAECAALVAELAATVDERLAGRRTGGRPDWTGPWLVLVLDGCRALADVPGLTALLARAVPAGITALCLDTDQAALPAACASVAAAHGETGSRVLVHDPADPDGVEVVLDTVEPGWATGLARALAPLVDPGADGAAALPRSCGLLDTLGIDSPDTGLDIERLADRWRHGVGGASTCIGTGPDGPLILDLVADGPHALVAGTTGAGKSELLQTLVAGLAVDQSPDDLSVLLIDYKGGAAFADCARLPHTVGLVTDLDAQLTERALRSLHSELRRRERLLAGAGVADLAGYRATGAPGGPLARLVIVVDEFATLAEELPDFVRGLVGVAQRGRSLGLHLVLATQRPSSAVSPEIRANTSLRIALRVTDSADSSDVIDAPDAAGIERAVPGRGYLRAGSALTCFQAAYGGAPVRSAAIIEVEPLGPWRRRPTTGDSAGAGTELGELVDALAKAAAGAGLEPAASPWLAPLPTLLPRAELPIPADPATITIGLTDRPDEQRRDPFALELARGSSLLVAGAPRSGRTGVLVTAVLCAAERYGPDELCVQVVDAAGELGPLLHDLPHCASALGPEDASLAPTLLRRLADTPAPDRLRSLLVVDGWDVLTAALGDVEAGECAELLTAVQRTAGVTVVVSGDRGVLAPRFAAGFDARLILRLADRNDFALAGVPVRDVPAALGPGRGLQGGDGALVQIAMPGDEPGTAATQRAAARVARRWHELGVAAHPAAVRLAALPEAVELAGLPDAGVGFLLGVGGDTARPLRIDLFRGAARFVIAGPPRSGRSTVLLGLLHQALDQGERVLVAAPSRSPLHAAATARSVPVVAPHADAGELGAAPRERTLVLVDDSDVFADTPVDDALRDWARRADLPLAVVVAGRSDDLATAYRGLAAQVRRAGTGLLLRPGPVDGEILGVRLPRRRASGPAGRGVIVGDPQWGPEFAGAEPLPIQVARP